MNREELEQLTKPELIDLLLGLQRPGKTLRTSSKPPSTDWKGKRESSRPGGAKPGHKGYACALAATPDTLEDHRPAHGLLGKLTYPHNHCVKGDAARGQGQSAVRYPRHRQPFTLNRPFSAACAVTALWRASSSASGAGGDLRRWQPERSCVHRWRWPANGARLGAAVQPSRT